jgi:thiol:disulfide interchange protein DsbD
VFGASSLCYAQTDVLLVGKPAMIAAKAGSTVESKLPLELRTGYHVNSNTPSDAYLIPLKLTWTEGPVKVSGLVFPKPSMEKYSFSEKPLSVFSGRFEILTRFSVAPGAQPGPVAVAGKLRYQACNDRMCLAPKTVDVALQVNVVK